MRKLFSFLLFILLAGTTMEQQIAIIGMAAGDFLRFNRAQNQYVDVNYFNGKISDMTICQEKIPLGLRKKLNVCTIYSVSDDIIRSKIIRYKNISIEELKEWYSKIYNRIGEYYFSDDYEYFYILSLPSDGYPTAKLKMVNKSKLSNEILMKIKSGKQDKLIQLQKCEKKEDELKEIKNKVYHIQESHPEEYKRMYTELQDEIMILISCLSYSDKKDYLNSRYDMKTVQNMYQNSGMLIASKTPFHFSFIYNIYHETKRDILYTENIDQRNFCTVQDNEGKDILRTIPEEIRTAINYMHVDLPKFTEDGISINTEANFKFNIDYLKAACEVKVKNGETVFLKGTKPSNTEVIQLINRKIISDHLTGTHRFMYEKVKVGNREEIHLFVVPQQLNQWGRFVGAG